MKNLILKISLFIVIIVGLVYGFLYEMRISENSKNEQTHEEFVNKEVFSKDSENRGFSDEAKKSVDEVLKIVNNDPEITKLFYRMKKMTRIRALSKTPEEFHNNFINWSKTHSCVFDMIDNKYPNVDIFPILDQKNEEDERIEKLNHALSIYLTKDFSFEKDYEMMNVEPTEQECKDYLNE